MTLTDAELVAASLAFRSGILNGKSSQLQCFVVSWPLSGYLNSIGIENELVCGTAFRMDHYWIMLKDGRYLDPTADQFSTPERPLPAIYLGPKTRDYKTLHICRKQPA